MKKLRHEERRKLTEKQIKEMSREELNSLSLDYWQTLLEQQQVLKNIALVGDKYSKEMAQGVLNGTLNVIFDEGEESDV